jgi:hypothetical protein
VMTGKPLMRLVSMLCSLPPMGWGVTSRGGGA